MGQEIIVERETSKIFNTSLEISLRLLFILCRFHPNPLNTERLSYFEYFTIHSGDLDKKESSLHPKYPFRSSELIVKRELVSQALKILLAKQLIVLISSKFGFSYRASNIGMAVQKYFSSNYSKELERKCEWLFINFTDSSDEDLRRITADNLEIWGGEFYNESRFRGNI